MLWLTVHKKIKLSMTIEDRGPCSKSPGTSNTQEVKPIPYPHTPSPCSHPEEGIGDTQSREMDVEAAQETEGGAGEQSWDGHGERTGERDDNTTRGIKRTREDDEWSGGT